MKANELRIGNWVDYSDHISEHGRVYRISSAIDLNTIEQYPEYINPISLRSEFIEHFGFELFDYDVNEDDDENEIVQSYKRKYRNFEYRIHQPYKLGDSYQFTVKWRWAEEGVLANIDYVHQLQNLYFALTGEELTIKDEA